MRIVPRSSAWLMCLLGAVTVTTFAHAATRQASARRISSMAVAAGPALTLDRGTLSFRGLSVTPGSTGPAQTVLITSSGRASVRGVSVSVSGDFVITANTCFAQLPAASEATAAPKPGQCAVSVAFKPQSAGEQQGVLTIAAPGIAPQLVPLVAGTPVIFASVPSGASSVQWVELPAGTGAVTGTAAGPFAIALRTSYANDNAFNGVPFGTTASSEGTCTADVTVACRVWLGIEQLPTAPIGQFTGSVVLSTGLTYALTGNVQGPTLLVTPASIDLGNVLVSVTSGLVPVAITNLSAAAISIKPPVVSEPFKVRSCGNSIAAGATCVIEVSFESSATGPATGLLQLVTSAGSAWVNLSATGVASPTDISISPGSGVFTVQYDGTPDSLKSHTQEFTLKNISTTDSVGLQDFSFNFCGFQGCLVLVGNSCYGTLAPAASCQFKAYDWLSPLPPGSGSYIGNNIQIDYTVGGAVSYFDIPYRVSYTSSPATAQLSLSQSVMVFPATAHGAISAAQTLTVKNVSSTIYQVAVSSFRDFIADPSCGVVLPGNSCSVTVRYVPTSGRPNANATLLISATDLNSENLAIVSTGVSVSGTSVPTTALANPGIPPLITVDSSGVNIKNIGSVPLFVDSVVSTAGLASSGCATLAPNEECFLTPSFVFDTGSNCTSDLCSVTLFSNSATSPDLFNVPAANIGYQEAFLSTGAGLNVFSSTAVNSASPLTNLSLSAGAETYGVSTPLAFVSSLQSDFTINNGCGNTLSINSGNPPGANCNITVSFTPHSAGFKVGTLQFLSNWGMGTFVFAGNALAGPAGVAISPAALVIPAGLGKTAALPVVLKNTGSTTLALRPAALAGPLASQFALGRTTCGTSLMAGASCTVNVAYAASVPTGANATLIVFSGSNTSQTVSLQGITPALATDQVQWIGTPDPNSSTPYLPFGTTATAKVVLSSTSSSIPQTIKTVALVGAFGANYTITANTCNAGLVITTNTCEVDLLLSPKVVATLTESLVITTEFGPNTVDISAAVTPAKPMASVSNINFGYQTVGVTSAPVSVTVTNINPVNESVYPTLVSGQAGADPNDFVLINTTCPVYPARLAPQASCVITLQFAPSVAGSRSAIGLVYSDAADPTMIALSGIGFTSATPSVKTTYNVYAIGSDGSHTPTGGIDGYGNAYSSELLPRSLIIGGVSFDFGAAKQLDALRDTTISLPAGSFASIKLLASGLNGNQPNQRFVVHYSDGTTSSVVQGMSDWHSPQHYNGETVAATMAYRLDVNGTAHAGPYFLYEYSLQVAGGKTATSLTLPANANVVTLAISMAPATLPNVAVLLDGIANVSGIYRDGVANTGGLDGLGNVYSSNKLGASIMYGGLAFTLLPSDTPDAVTNLTVPLPPTEFSTLRLLAVGVNGNQPNPSLVITYTDGTAITVRQGFSDWHTPQFYPGETQVADTSYRLSRSGQKHAGHYLVYGYTIALDPTKTVKGVALPKTRNVVVLGISLSP